MLKRKMSVVIIVMVFSIVMSACTKSQNVGITDANADVTLRWVIMSPGEQQDAKKVWSRFNEVLSKYLPNTKVEFEVIPSSEYGEKWRLMAASAEEIDIAWTGYTLTYADEIRKGSYKSLNELIDQYGKDLKRELPDFVWELASVGGKIYSVPNMQQMTYIPCIITQKKLVDQYSNAKEIEKIWKSSPEPTAEAYKVLGDYLAKLKANGEIRKGMSGSMGQFRLSGYETITSIANIKKGDNNFKVVSELDVPGNLLYYRTVADWYKKGYIMNDILSVQNAEEFTGKENGYTLYSHQWLEGESERRSSVQGYPITTIPISDEFYIANTPSATSTVIPRTSKNPERAMQLIDLLNTKKGKELYNMLVYGLEGEHYKKISENRIETFEYSGTNPTANIKYGLPKWVVGNTFNSYLTQNLQDGWNEYLAEVHTKAEKSPLFGFSPDLREIKTEVAQVQAVKTEYDKVLRFGAMENFDATWNEYRNKMKLAGEEKIVAEIQKQLDEWRKNK